MVVRIIIIARWHTDKDLGGVKEQMSLNSILNPLLSVGRDTRPVEEREGKQNR